MTRLPGILGEIADIAGLEPALQLARSHGGLQISLSDAAGSALVVAIGQEAATAIVERLGRGKIIVPMATARGQRGRRAQAAEMLAKGATNSEVARACDIHTRTVWRVKKTVREEDELPLFKSED